MKVNKINKLIYFLYLNNIKVINLNLSVRATIQLPKHVQILKHYFYFSFNYYFLLANFS